MRGRSCSMASCVGTVAFMGKFWRCVWASICIAVCLITCRTWAQSGTDTSTSPSDIYSLHALYNSTNGAKWHWAKHPGTRWFFNSTSNPCSQNWVGVLCSNSTIDGYLFVSSLSLNDMGLIGFIPEQISGLTYIDEMILSNNKIEGTLPTSLGYLHNLTILDLESNHINGTIPETFVQAQYLRILALGDNHLTGSLPEFLGQLTELTLLQLNHNELSGSIPDSFRNLTQLSMLWVSFNNLIGTLPNFLAELPLVNMLLNRNEFTGTIPTGLATLSSLKVLRLINNQLHGTIPAGFGDLPNLSEMTLGVNYLSGNIPSDLLSSTQLQFLLLDYNLLTGTIPSVSATATTNSKDDNAEGGAETQLRLCSAIGNQLTGSIPPSLGNLVNLTVLQLASNQLTSTIPSQLGSVIRIVSFDLSSNQLTGTLPESLENLLRMEYFKMGSNHLVGTIPSYFGKMAGLGFLLLQYNHFTGTLPGSLSLIPSLQHLFVFENLLVGSLAGVFDPTTQALLAVLQLDGNSLSGQIPEAVFQLPSLNTVVLDRNCFDGSLPETVCEAMHLRTLSASGLHTATTCRSPIFGSLADTYTLESSIDGGVPACYFALPQLSTLHLSGNGLTGPLPDGVQIGSFLIDVVLSHNRLTGSIPANFQQRQWYNLDLSYNRLSGTLRSDFATVPPNATSLVDFGLQNITHPRIPDAALVLRNNRLSRTIPEILHHMENITILEGNIFSCQINHHDLPSHDNARYTYSCGSNTFNISYAVYMTILGMVLVTLLALYRYRDGLKQHIDVNAAIATLQKWITFADWYRRDDGDEQYMVNYGYLVQLYDKICLVSAYCTLYMVVVLMPVYAVLTAYYSTHSDGYAWVVSASYLSGNAALAIMIAFVSILVALFLYWFKNLTAWARERLIYHVQRINSLRHSSINTQRTNSTWRNAVIYFAYAATNIVVVVLVNVAYVIAEINAPPLFQTFAQLALSAFRLLWNRFGSQMLLRASLRQLSSDQRTLQGANNSTFFAVQLFVTLFNAIIVPCAVIAVIGPDCFSSAFVPANSVHGNVQYPVCVLPSANRGCLAYRTETDTLSFAPPFVYSYECSGSLVTFYAPTFVYTGLMVTFLNPLLNHLQRWVFIHTPRTSRWFWLIDKMVPRVLRPVSAATVQYDAPYQYWKPYFDANFLLLTIVSHLGVILTFGVVFPPVAVVMLIAMVSVAYLSRLHLGRFLSEAVAENVHKYVDIIEEECREAGSVRKLYRCVRMLAVIAGLFYPFFLFDTLGDKSGAANAYWVFIVMPLAPVVIFAVLDVVRQNTATYREKALSFARQGLELQGRSGQLRSSGEGGGDVQLELQNELNKAAVVQNVLHNSEHMEI